MLAYGEVRNDLFVTLGQPAVWARRTWGAILTLFPQISAETFWALGSLRAPISQLSFLPQ